MCFNFKFELFYFFSSVVKVNCFNTENTQLIKEITHILIPSSIYLSVFVKCIKSKGVHDEMAASTGVGEEAGGSTDRLMERQTDGSMGAQTGQGPAVLLALLLC